MIVTLTEDAVFEEDVDDGVEDEVFLLDAVLLIVKKLHDALLSNQGTTRLQRMEQRQVCLLLHLLLQEARQVRLRLQQEVLRQEPIRQHHRRVLQDLFQQQLLQVLLPQHRLMVFQPVLLIQVLVLRHHCVHLPLQHVMDVVQQRIPIHLQLWVMQVQLDRLRELIHHTMSIEKT